MRLSGVWAMEDMALNEIMGAASAALRRYAAGPVDQAERDGLPIRRDGRLAIVPLMGPMTKRVGWLGAVLGFVSTEKVRRAVEAAADDGEIDSILLVIDSPGGSVDGLLELAQAVKAAGERKPVIAQIDGTGASAAYWVASQASEVRAGRHAQIGSIGVRLALYDYSKAFEEMGIEPVPVDTGEFKSLGLMGTEITDSHKAYLQGIVDAYFEDFVNAVAAGRGLDRKTVMESADGRVFMAADALDRGLIDTIRSTDETINEMRAQSRPSGGRPRALRARVALNSRRSVCG